MANESLYTQISDLIPLIWESALFYAQHSFVASRYITSFTDVRGMVTRNVSEYIETAVTDNLAETADLSTARQAFDRDLLTTLTPKEIGKQFLITYRRLDSDTENVLVDAARDIGYTIGKKVEQDILAQFANLTGGLVGGSGNSFSLDMIFQARAVMEANAIPAPYTCVIHPYQYLDIHSDLTSRTNAAPLDVRNTAMQSYYVSRLADVDIVVSSLTPYTGATDEVQNLEITGSPTGGTFKLTFRGWETSAIAYNASSATIDAALEALPSIGAGNVAVTSGSDHVVTFGGDLAGQNLPMITLSDNSLTGGTDPSVAITETTAGVGYATAGFFNREAIAIDWRRGLLIEPEKDASARAWELNASAIYAIGTWRSARGMRVISDASAPNVG